MTDPTQLIQRYCQSDDRTAFSEFYNQQANRLWRFLVARGCDQDTAYDILSEAFLRFTQNVCKNPGSPVALLFRIAINLHIDHYRHEKTANTVRNPDYFEEIEEYQSITMSEKELIRRLVSTLKIDEQNLLLMRYWIGLTHKEVAQALGMPEGTVRRNSAALLKKLAEKWNGPELPTINRILEQELEA